MSGPPRVRPMNCTEAETRSVLGPAGNKTTMVTKQGLKPQKAEKVLDQVKGKKAPSSPAELSPKQQLYVPSILKSNFSLNASCSSDASTDSTQSRASTGRIRRRSLAVATTRIRRTQSSPKSEKSDKASGGTESDTGSVTSADGLPARKRCAWVTPNTDPCYVAFHDEEWGVPVHNDKKLFELLSFSTALAELTWPAILTKRHLFREVFLDFDPIAVSKLNEKKILTPGSTASSLLSEVKLRAVIENARQVCKLIIEFGSFDKYIWGFVNHKPTVNNFRYPRQVPIKTSKADVISKDLVKRGFRGVGPTVVYSFMQVSGITNDHLVSCFRFHDCVVDVCDKNITLKAKVEDKQLLHEDSVELGLSRAIGEFNLLSEE